MSNIKNADPAFCKKSVWNSGGWDSSQCSRKAVLDGYCRQHLPYNVEKRREAATEAYNAKWRRHEVSTERAAFKFVRPFVCERCRHDIDKQLEERK